MVGTHARTAFHFLAAVGVLTQEAQESVFAWTARIVATVVLYVQHRDGITPNAQVSIYQDIINEEKSHDTSTYAFD